MKPNRFIIFLFSVILVFGIVASVQATPFTYEFEVALGKEVKDNNKDVTKHHIKYKYEGPLDIDDDGFPAEWKFEYKHYYEVGTLKTKVEAWNIETVEEEKKDKKTGAVTTNEKENKVGKIKSDFTILDEGEFHYFAVLDQDNMYPGSPFYILGNFKLDDKSSTFEGIFTNVNPNPVPEPATMLLVGGGIMGIAFVGKKRKR